MISDWDGSAEISEAMASPSRHGDHPSGAPDAVAAAANANATQLKRPVQAIATWEWSMCITTRARNEAAANIIRHMFKAC